MRRVISLLAVAAFIAGCATAASPTDDPTAAPEVTVLPSTVPTSAPTPQVTPTVISGRLTFDGKTCAYTGPTVVTAPAVLRVDFAPTDEGYAINVGNIVGTATIEDVKAVDEDPSYGPAPGKKVPDWLLPSSWHAWIGSGTPTYDLQIMKDVSATYDQVAVTCVRDPWTSEKPTDTIEGRVTGPIIKLVAD